VEVGRLYRGRITDLGKKGDGIARIDGLVVFVTGVSKDDYVVFRVTELAERFARAEFVAHAQPGEAGEAGKADAGKPAAKPKRESVTNELTGKAKADDVQAGAVFNVEVAEPDRKNPEDNGVARIDGLVVFVPGTHVGDRVQIRITERKARFAFSEVVGPAEAESEEKPDGAHPE
jgi:predicted RNA-binding protein with TRAM domain